MAYITLMVLSAGLLLAFLALTSYENRRGTRVFALARAGFDKRIGRLGFVLTHVDFESFTREQVRTLIVHLAHDIAHISLLTIRAIERPLTRTVKNLRTRHGIETATNAAPRAFVKTMSEFKQQLAATRPPVPQI